MTGTGPKGSTAESAKAWDDVPHEDDCPGQQPPSSVFHRECQCLRLLVLDARSWARHGYEIGQRTCTWSDHGVAPAWLTGEHGEALTPKCVTMGHEDIPAAAIGVYDDGEKGEPNVRYCRECAATMIGSGEFIVQVWLEPSSKDGSAECCPHDAERHGSEAGGCIECRCQVTHKDGQA